MAGMSWVRVDTSLASNHKTLALLTERGGDHALCVYIFALGHAGQQGTDGFVPDIALGLIHGKKRDAELLVQVGLWQAVPGGYNIHDWAEYQPAGEETRKRSDKARLAAHARWAKSNAQKVDA